MGNQITMMLGYFFLFIIEMKDRIMAKLTKTDTPEFKIPKHEDNEKDKPSKLTENII